MSTVQRRRLVGLVIAIFVLGLCVVTFSGLLQQELQPGGTKVTATFADTQVMAKGSPVRVNGVQVGTVTGSRLNPGDRSAMVIMSISDRSVLPLYRNATATLKWRTILGANYAIDLTRGEPRSGVLTSDQIDESHTVGQVELDQILDTLGSQQRTGIRETIDSLPKSFNVAPDLGNTLTALSQAAPSLTAGFSAVEGEQNGELHRLIANTASTVRALDAPNGEVTDLIQGGAVTLHTTGADSVQIQESLSDSAATLPSVRATLVSLNTTLGDADPLISRLQNAAPKVAPTVAALHPTVSAANQLLNTAKPLLTSLQPAANALKSASIKGLPLVKSITPSVNKLADAILPDLARVYKGSGRATYEMIGPTLAVLDSAASGYDSDGHIVTLTPGASANLVDTLPCRVYLNDPNEQRLLVCQSLESYIDELFGSVTSGSLLGVNPSAKTSETTK